MSDKDYSLLRPFDLEAAKRGEAICYINFMLVVEFVGEATAIGCIATKEKDGRIAITPRSQFRLAPLCWVEGKPVYKGDVLYSSFFAECDQRTENGNNAGRFVASGILDGGYIEAGERGSYANTPTKQCTWTPPKVKREGWVNVYGYQRPCHIHATEELANQGAMQACGMIDQNRLACIRIEWEE